MVALFRIMAMPRAIGSLGSLRGSLVDLGGAGALRFLGIGHLWLIAPVKESRDRPKTDKQTYDNRCWIPEPKHAIRCR